MPGFQQKIIRQDNYTLYITRQEKKKQPEKQSKHQNQTHQRTYDPSVGIIRQRILNHCD